MRCNGSNDNIEIIEVGTFSIVQQIVQDSVTATRLFAPTAIDPGNITTIVQAINYLLQSIRDLQLLIESPVNPAAVTFNGQPLTYNGQTVTYTP